METETGKALGMIEVIISWQQGHTQQIIISLVASLKIDNVLKLIGMLIYQGILMKSFALSPFRPSPHLFTNSH